MPSIRLKLINMANAILFTKTKKSQDTQEEEENRRLLHKKLL